MSYPACQEQLFDIVDLLALYPNQTFDELKYISKHVFSPEELWSWLNTAVKRGIATKVYPFQTCERDCEKKKGCTCGCHEPDFGHYSGSAACKLCFDTPKPRQPRFKYACGACYAKVPRDCKCHPSSSSFSSGHHESHDSGSDSSYNHTESSDCHHESDDHYASHHEKSSHEDCNSHESWDKDHSNYDHPPGHSSSPSSSSSSGHWSTKKNSHQSDHGHKKQTNQGDRKKHHYSYDSDHHHHHRHSHHGYAPQTKRKCRHCGCTPGYRYEDRDACTIVTKKDEARARYWIRGDMNIVNPLNQPYYNRFNQVTPQDLNCCCGGKAGFYSSANGPCGDCACGSLEQRVSRTFNCRRDGFLGDGYAKDIYQKFTRAAAFDGRPYTNTNATPYGISH